MSDVLETNDLDKLKELAGALGLTVDGDDPEDYKAAIKPVLGEFGFVQEAQMQGVSEEARKRHAARTLAGILDGDIEIPAGTFATKYPKGRLPRLMPRQVPWEGRRMRISRIRQTDQDLVGLILGWNGSNFLLPLEAKEADVPWPHYQILKNAWGKRLKQKRVMNEDGRLEYRDNWIMVKSYPFEEHGITPGTEHLPTGMKEYMYEMYVEGFPDWTPQMWRQACLAWEFSDPKLDIKPSMPPEDQLRTRRQVLFDRLGLIDFGDDEDARDERIEHIRSLVTESPLANVA